HCTPEGNGAIYRGCSFCRKVSCPDALRQTAMIRSVWSSFQLSGCNIDNNCLRVLMFLGNRLTFSNKCLNIEANGIPGHDYSLFDGFTLCYASWQSWYSYGVTSLLGIRLQNDGIFVLTHRLMLVAVQPL